MVTSQEVKSALATCIESLADPEQWPDALRLFAHSLGAESCRFLRYDPAIKLANGLDELPAYTTDGDVRHFDGTGHTDSWAAVHFKVDQQFWCLKLIGNVDAGRIKDGDARAFSEHALQLSRLVALAERFAFVAATSGIELLGRLGSAAILINSERRLLHSNPPSQVLLGDVLNVVDGRLHLHDAACDKKLTHLLSILLHRFDHHLKPPQPLVSWHGEHPRFLIQILPVGAVDSHFEGCIGAVLVLTDMLQKHEPDGDVIRVAFSLTQAEARLATALAAGSSLEEMAQEFGVSYATLRSQLRSIFSKTGTKRQGQLVAYLNRIAQSK